MTPQIDATFTPTVERRSPSPYVVAAVAISAIALGWFFYSRTWARPQTVHVNAAAARRNAATVAYLGNGQLKVLSFDARPAEVRPGGRALVCYGVSNASSVRIEPAVGETWPSISRCMEVTATRDTDYKLIASDGAGNEQTRTVSLRIRH